MNCMRRKRIQVIWINLFHSYFVFYNTKTFLLYLLFVMETNKQEKTRQSSFFFCIHTFYFYPTILDSSKINKVWKFLYDDVDVDQILLEIKIHKLYYPCVCLCVWKYKFSYLQKPYRSRIGRVESDNNNNNNNGRVDPVSGLFSNSFIHTFTLCILFGCIFFSFTFFYFLFHFIFAN